MDDEFKLCWKNFQDNIASGFQNLYDRGDLVDVTLACDGKLLQAHKIVLAICSPYFQEIFITNPCKHPIIILKDVSYTIMCELLEFMYQGVVNVKHTELQAFMKIGQLLQIKGLATNSSSAAAASSLSDKSNSNQNPNADADVITSHASTSNPKSVASAQDELENNNEKANKSEKPSTTTDQTTSNSNTPQRTQSPIMSPASPSLNISNVVSTKSNDSPSFHMPGAGVGAGGMAPSHKRHLSDFNSDTLSIYSRNKIRRSLAANDHGSENNDASEMGGNGCVDQMNAEDFFLPHISMVEQRYDLNNVKREGSEHQLHPNGPGAAAAAAAAAAASLRNSFNPTSFGLDYTFYKNGGVATSSSSSAAEYPNDLNPSGDFCKGFANHMDIPPNCPNVVMLSSTSLLHGNCVFNRNNTVATQQGMKTYWLCKSYRISMCRARCITHQGKIISATGVHNHAPHMRGNNAGGVNNMGSSGDVMSPSSNNGNNNTSNCPPPQTAQMGTSSAGLRYAQNMPSPGGNMFQASFHGQHHGHPMSPMTPPSAMQHSHPISADAALSMNSTTSHHFVPSMSNLTQHHPSHQLLTTTASSTIPQHLTPSNNAMPSIIHGSAMNSPQHPQTHSGGYDVATTSAVMEQNRITNHNQPTTVPYGPNEESNERLPVHNAAELSPPIAKGRYNEDSHDSLHKSSSHQHQQQTQQHHQRHQPTVQVIDSITISPGGNGHNFKMEPL